MNINLFVQSLTDWEREIAAAYVRIPNTPDWDPEMMRLKDLYGRDLHSVMKRVEDVRQSLGMDYGSLQTMLQRRLLD